MKIEICNLMHKYVDICCHALDQKEFQTILAKDVQLKHQTDKEIPIFAAGKKDVVELFQKYIFGNTSNVEIFAIGYKQSKGKKYILELQVAENKYENGKINRYFFHEKTVFILKESKKDPKKYKITLIDTDVTKTLLRSTKI